MIVDLAPEAFAADPSALYREMLDAGRVHSTTFGIPAVCRHEDCVRVLTTPEWSVEARNVDPVRGLFAPTPDLSPPMSKLDPPRHTAVRRPLSRPFTPRAVRELGEKLGAIADELAVGLAGTSSFDVVTAFAEPFLARTLSAVFGIGADDVESAKRWARTMSWKMEIQAVDPDRLESQRAATSSTRALIRRLTRECTGPDTALLQRLIVGGDDGMRGLGADELAANAALIIMAAHEPTISLIAGAVVSLAQHPQQIAVLGTSDQPINSRAIEELIRHVSPIPARPRVAATDVSIGEHRFRRGEQVLVMIGAANRDPRVFADPDVLLLSRDVNPHLGFGLGRHVCLGAHLARLQTAIALSALVRRGVRLMLAADVLEDAVAYERRFAIRRPLRVMVRAA
jgi:cytochrome P450